VNCVEKITYEGDWILMVGLKAKSVNIIQIYMPMSNHLKEETEDMYCLIEKL